MNNNKLNKLYNFLIKSSMDKQSSDLLKLIKNASRNYTNPDNRYIYIINYYNKDKSIYYIGKAKFLHRRMSEHKMGVGPHIISKLTDLSWKKRISEIVILSHTLQEEFPKKKHEEIEGHIAKILNGIVNRNCSIKVENDFLDKTIQNIKNDISNNSISKVVVIGGGLGENVVDDNYEYNPMEDIEAQDCEELETKYKELASLKDSYNSEGQTLINGDSLAEDKTFLGALSAYIGSKNITFEDVSKGTNREKNALDSSVMNLHHKMPNSNYRSNMFKLFQHSKQGFGKVDYASQILNAIKSGSPLNAEQEDFLRSQIYNILFNYMVYLQKHYRGILIITLSFIFGSTDMNKSGFYISANEIREIISSLKEETFKYVIDNIYGNEVNNYSFLKNRQKLLQFLNLLILDKNADNIAKMFRDMYEKNLVADDYYKKELEKLYAKDFNTMVSDFIKSMELIANNRAFDNLSDNPNSSTYLFFGEYFRVTKADEPSEIRDQHKARRNLLRAVTKSYTVFRQDKIPYSQQKKYKKLVGESIKKILKDFYKKAKDSVLVSLKADSFYQDIRKKMKKAITNKKTSDYNDEALFKYGPQYDFENDKKDYFEEEVHNNENDHLNLSEAYYITCEKVSSGEEVSFEELSSALEELIREIEKNEN